MWRVLLLASSLPMNEVAEESPSLFDPEHPLAHVGRKIFVAVTLLAVVIIYYVTRYSKGAVIVRTLLHVAPLTILAMLVIQTLYFVFQGILFQSVYRTIGYPRSLFFGSTLYIAMNLINTVAPVAGLSGSIYMVYLERKGGMERSEGLLINFLYYMVDYLVFLIVLLVTLAYLFVTTEVSRTILWSSSLFAVYVLFLAFFGTLLITRPTVAYSVIERVNKFLGRFRGGKPFIKRNKIQRFVTDLQETWLRSQQSLEHLYRGAAAAFGLHACCLLVLWLAFKALHVDTTIQILMAGYTVGTLLNIVSVTPGGIGFAEGGMTAVFASLGIPVEQALLVSLLYRTVFVWYPLLLGLGSIHLLPKVVSAQPPRLQL